MYLLRLMKGLRQRGHAVVLFAVAGTRLWNEAGAIGIERVAWSSLASADGGGMGARRGRAVESAPSRGKAASQAHLSSTLPGLRSAARRMWRGAKRVLLGCAPPALKLLAGSACEVLHLRRLFKRHPVDVVHINVHGYEVAGIAAKSAGIPSIGMYCLSPVEVDHLRYRMIRHSSRYYSRILAKSPIQGQELAAMYGLKVAGYIRNGIAVDRFVKAAGQRRFDQSPLIIIFASRLEAKKGAEPLIRAIAKLPVGSVKLLMAGEGPLMHSLQRIVASLNLGASVTLLGAVDDMPNLYARGHCFSAVTSETWAGSIVLEAMASGMIVIAGNQDVIKHGQTGLCCPAMEPDVIANSIREVLDMPVAERVRMASEAQAAAVRQFDNERMISETEAVYANLAPLLP